MNFLNIYKETEERMRMALLSLWAPGNHPMRPAIEELLKKEPLMANPVFQSTFGWTNVKTDDWKKYLNKRIIEKLHIGEKYAPYTHQAESWKSLKENKSIVVTSGTGSGKTECFMYPVISDLFEQEKDNSIKALFLYPLNALMEDQKKRLSDYCSNAGLKYAVYNGDTGEFRPSQELMPNEVGTRKEIRDIEHAGTRPQILLTNPSMLEYIMVRQRDQQMIQESAGKLRWIIIDEAHTYSGSAAVELSYQIKRILDAFKVDAKDVRFACTSATIGGKEEGIESLKQFIATVTGQDESQIKVIGGKRDIPKLDIENLEKELIANNLPSAQRVLALREKINNLAGMSLPDVIKALCGKDMDTESSLSLLDRLCDLKQNGNSLLSLRAHFFMRSISGIYGCANEKCEGTSGTPFGHLTTYKGTMCPICNSPLLEIVQCKRCNSFLLMGTSDPTNSIISSVDDSHNQTDYFTIDNDDEENEEQDFIENNGVFFLLPHNKEKFCAPYSKAQVSFSKLAHSRIMGSKLIPVIDNIDVKEYKGVKLKDIDDNTTWVDVTKDGKSYCPSCGKLAKGKQLNFKHFRIPVNFINQTIAPVFLKECASNGHSWGKYIAFTDSRQGTAISAKSFNINVERMRGWEKSLKLLTDKQSNNTTGIDLSQIPESMRQQVAALMYSKGGDGTASIYEVANEIFDDTVYSHITKEDSSPNKEAYKASLIRGFIGRRPAFEVNVEGLGLLTLEYPALKDAKVPASLHDLADRKQIIVSDKDWQDYLKIILDYFVRMGNHIQPLINDERKYIRDSNLSTPFAGPNDNRSGCTHWPILKKKDDGNVEIKQSRTILVLCAGLGVHTLTDLQKNAKAIENIIADAWTTLKEKKLLTEVYADDREGYNHPRFYGDERYVGCFYLDISAKETNKTCRVRLTKEVSVCPITGSKLDTTFMGYSPLMSGEVNLKMFANYKCSQNVSMPIRPKDNNQLEEWLSSDKDVANLKTLGLWGDRYGDIYNCKPTFLAAEHSAQQSKERLRQYTQEFSQENPTINVLQCSTTMEMGVDIGDIDIVLMDTIPPTAANYLQRVGRAGRMQQTKAVAFSLCNNTPVGQHAFANPMWALQTTNHMIKVRESNTIIQRHINSYFFRKFICESGLGIQATMSVDEFLSSTCKEFIDFLEEIEHNSSVKAEFHKTFGDHRFTIGVTRLQIQNIKEKYDDTIKELEEALTTFKNDVPRKQAISIQIDKCKQAKLLGYLSENQFIPNANMPTGVVSFDFRDKDQSDKLYNLIQKKNRLKKDIDATQNESEKTKFEMDLNKVQSQISSLNRSTSASRDIRTALNEYAPEQTVVVNEKNYVSAGVMLFGAYNESTQSRAIYHCDTCGRVEYSENLDENKECPHCQVKYRNIIDSNAKSAYTRAYEPVGFRADQNVNASREEKTEKRYYDIRPLLLDVKWQEKKSINLCDVVSSGDNGKILFYNVGSGNGFALCKRCGRTAVESQYEHSIPYSVRPGHNKLWFAQDGTCCEANEKDIARNVVFTGSHYTCYSVLRLYSDKKNYANDEQLAYSMGVLLTRALAESEGIDESEVGFGVKQEENAWLIFIYDTAKGGCGYSLKFFDPVACQEIFDIARKNIENSGCRCHEDGGACTKCLVDRNNYRYSNKLSKAKAMDWLERQKNKIDKVPAEIIAEYPNTVIAPANLKSILKDASKSSEVTEINITASDVDSDVVVSDWVSQHSDMGKIIQRSIERGIKIKISVEYHPEYHTNESDKLQFVGLKEKFPDCQLEFVKNLGKFKTALIITKGDKQRRYFVTEDDSLTFSDNWGKKATIVYSDNTIANFISQNEPVYTINPSEIVRQGAVRISSFQIKNYFSKAIAPFVLKKSDIDALINLLDDKNVIVTFSDMYVNSALASMMFVYLVKEMKELFKFKITDINLQIDSPRRKCINDNWNVYTPISHNFPSKEEADEFTDNVVKDVLEITPEFSIEPAEHHRWVRLTTEDGNIIEIRPDHGISGGWKCFDRYMNLDSLDGCVSVYNNNEDVVFYFVIKKNKR